jgi:hypothetical protein
MQDVPNFSWVRYAANEEHVVELANDLVDGGKHGNVNRALDRDKGRDTQHGPVG